MVPSVTPAANDEIVIWDAGQAEPPLQVTGLVGGHVKPEIGESRTTAPVTDPGPVFVTRTVYVVAAPAFTVSELRSELPLAGVFVLEIAKSGMAVLVITQVNAAPALTFAAGIVIGCVVKVIGVLPVSAALTSVHTAERKCHPAGRVSVNVTAVLSDVTGTAAGTAGEGVSAAVVEIGLIAALRLVGVKEKLPPNPFAVLFWMATVASLSRMVYVDVAIGLPPQVVVDVTP